MTVSVEVKVVEFVLMGKIMGMFQKLETVGSYKVND
jgi:hypothetical protein